MLRVVGRRSRGGGRQTIRRRSNLAAGLLHTRLSEALVLGDTWADFTP